ncbi:penicillin-binding protein 1A [Bacillus pakistanensis]|uniref:Penicillin-binding protein 1A n=1 Tax=Rossellomorea pakistanensis TaxID=992288 RepID=A0ABS2N8X4_9BACI|nr:penicillin-binding protein 1A [Bacillus pakistanensis]MBM7584311.1 penicillin-binding protein 1A [Bacillus pakistanensis]
MAGEYKSREEKRKAQQTSKKNMPKGKGKNRSLFKKIIISLFLIGIVGMLAGAGLFAYYASNAPKLNEELLKDPIASDIYDMNGDLITTVGKEKRDYVNYDDIPSLMEDAILATEDNRFYKHNGIDLIRLGGAVVANITQGFGSEGASTLTQQVIKRSFLSPEKTLERKAQEAWLAIKLEQEYTKEEIFEMYFNKVYMSDGIHGFGTAAKHYFGKDLKDLELHEAALLAGMPQSPNNYNPFEEPETAKKRRDIVLSLMHQHKKITKEEMEKAQNMPVKDSLIPKEEREKATGDKYSAFIDAVIDEVDKMGDYNLFSDGLKVYTTLDPNAQKRVEQILNGEAIDFEYPTRHEAPMQAGITLMDTKTGEIRAIGGGRERGDVKRGFNFAIDSKRQPGSTIKPLIDYAPAIEYLDWSTYHQINDEPYEYSTGQEIGNWDGQYKGNISIREALWDSRNVPAVKTLQEVGLDKAKGFVANLGLNFENVYESYALGGISPGVNTVQMAGSYAAFGNKGVYNKPHTVKKVVLRDGETEVKNTEEPQTAMKSSTAYMITDMLKDVIYKSNGTGIYAAVPGLPMAGKSGTTNYTDEDRENYGITDTREAPDSWFVGYTTNYTASVWTGYEERKYSLNPRERRIAQYITADIMSYVHEGIETADFEKPANVVESPVEIGSSPAKLPSDFTPENRISYELFLKGTAPQKVSKEFDRIDAPAGLKAKYDQKANKITLKWDYKKDKDVHFEVSASINGGASQVLTTTKEKGLNIENIQPGSQYSFEVVAISGDQRSDPATTSIEVKDKEKDDEDENEGNEEGQPGDGPPGNGEGNGPGGNNGQGPGDGNGQGNGGPGDGQEGDGQGGDTGTGGEDPGGADGGQGGGGDGGGTQPPEEPVEEGSPLDLFQ